MLSDFIFNIEYKKNKKTYYTQTSNYATIQ